MTVVGKILVFLNLVFSLVVGAFAVMDYSARTQFMAAFKKLEEQYKVQGALLQAAQGKAEKLEKKDAALSEKFNRVGVPGVAPGKSGDPEQIFTDTVALVTKLNDEIKRLSDKLATNRDELLAAKKDVAHFKALQEGMIKGGSRYQADSEIIRKQLKVQMDKVMALTISTNDMRDAMVSAYIQRDQFKHRNTQMEAQMQDMVRENHLLRRNGTAGAGGVGRNTNPPPENIEGTVRRADGRLVTISLGSDNGLSRNQTLEVFRLGQNPRYIGRIRIVEVTPTQAIGEATGKLTMPIMANDRVASRIMGGP